MAYVFYWTSKKSCSILFSEDIQYYTIYELYNWLKYSEAQNDRPSATLQITRFWFTKNILITHIRCNAKITPSNKNIYGKQQRLELSSLPSFCRSDCAVRARNPWAPPPSPSLGAQTFVASPLLFPADFQIGFSRIFFFCIFSLFCSMKAYQQIVYILTQYSINWQTPYLNQT